MSLDPSVQSRFGGSKVRTGCLTCKARHLKCDEGKPSCARCIKGGRICRQPESTATAMRIVHYVSAPRRPPSTYPSLDEDERHYLHHFRTRTALDLAGVYNPDFWLRYTVHLVTAESAIKHAVIALAALHWKFEQNMNMSLAGHDIQYALSNYLKAINILTKSLHASSWKSPDTPLVACALFCAFESISYHLDSAISHASSGLKVAVQRQRDSTLPNASSIPSEVLYPWYTKLDIQKIELGVIALLPSRQRLQFTLEASRAGFSDIDEAQRSFGELVAAIYHQMYEIDRFNSALPRSQTEGNAIDTVVAFNGLLETYRSWCEAFDRLDNREIGEDRVGAHVLLQLWRIMLNINLQVSLREGEMGFDCHASDFQAVVDLAHEFVLGRNREQGVARAENDFGVAQEDDEDVRSEQLFLHHCSPNVTGLRGGYIGVHPASTPFVSGRTLDTPNLHNTTRSLIHRSRSSRIDTALPNTASEVLLVPHGMKPTYSFGPGIVSPLYIVVSRCREPSIRRQALLLLQRCKLREGLWDSALAARLGNRVMQIEEQSAHDLRSVEPHQSGALGHTYSILSANQIPNEARVRMVKPTFLPDRKSLQRYYLGWSGELSRAHEIEETWIEDVLEW